MKLSLALIILLSAAVSSAPVKKRGRSSFVAGVADHKAQDQLDKILKEGLLNDDDNVEKLRNLVEAVSDSEVVCGLLTFSIFCLDEKEGADTVNCTTDYTFAWTSIDQTVWAGQIIFMFAAFNWRVFAFEKGEVCSLSIENSIILNVTVPSLGNFCSTEECIEMSLKALTEQIPVLVNSSSEARIHSAAEIDPVLFPSLIASGAIALSLVSIISIYSHAKVVTKSKQHRKEPKKPKLYFQFWALHCSAIIFLGYTLYLNFEKVNDDPHRSIRITTTIVVVIASGFLPFFGACFDVETPTSCCRCCCQNKQCSYGCMLICHYVVLFVAVWFLTIATGFLFLAIPTIVLHYYINPIRTLVHIQLLASAAIYTNSLLALLIFQCERCLYPFVGFCKPEIINSKWKCCRYSFWTGFCSHCGTQLPDHEKKDDFCKSWCKYLCVRYSQPPESSPFIARVANHDSYYASYFKVENRDTSGLRLTTYICHPFSTAIILGILLFFVVLLSEFISLGNINSVSDLESLILLVPTSLLLLGSWYKLDIFLDIEPEKSEKDILGELLQEMKISNRSAPWVTIGDIQLYISDRDSITDEHGWLTDNVINAAQKLLKKQYPNYGGFQTCSLDKQSQYTIVREDKFVQILFVNGNHWITVSNVGTPEDNRVWVYDICTRANDEALTDEDLKTQIGLIAPKHDLQVFGSRLAKLPSTSTNPYDSGLFAIAFATTLCHDNCRSVENQDYEEEKIHRLHLKKCLELKNLKPFPLRWVKIKDLDIQLYQEDKKSITDEDGQLTDNIINAAQKLLKKKFPHTDGLQSCSRDKQLQYSIVKTQKFVQILFVNGNHWITVSNVETVTDKRVWVYDSCGGNESNIKTEIRLIYPENDFTVSFWTLENLPDGPSSCSSSALFAIALATSLCFNETSGAIQSKETYAKEELLRQHLVKCLEQGEMTRFPLRWVKIKDIQLYLSDRDSIKGCLTYQVIDAAQKLLQEQYSNLIPGFQSCALDNPVTNKNNSVQILFVYPNRPNHCITIFKAAQENKVWVYDSCKDGKEEVLEDNEIKAKIDQIYDNNIIVYGIRLTHTPADFPNYDSSALMAIAFATSLCFDTNHNEVNKCKRFAKVDVLQKHLRECLEIKEMAPFPLHWISIEGLELTTIDQKSITDDEGWLTDNVVNASQLLIRAHANNSAILGFQCCGPSKYTKVADDAKFVQITFISGNRKRWITISNIVCDQDSVNVYDPLYSKSNREELQDTNDENITVKIRWLCGNKTPFNVPLNYKPQGDAPQPGSALFAIAVAVTLCSPDNNNPATKNYPTQARALRQHLTICLERQEMTPFPLHWIMINNFELTTTDQSSITNDDGILTDNVINAVQKLLKNQFGNDNNVGGFQPCGPNNQHNIAITENQFVQILFVNGNRWITVSNVHHEGDVDVYDPLHLENERSLVPDDEVGQNIKEQIGLLRSGKTPYNVHIDYQQPPLPAPALEPPDAQLQQLPGGEGEQAPPLLLSGGAFLAIAIAATLCSPDDNDPTTKNYHTIQNNDAVRNRLRNCIVNRSMDTFRV